MPFFITTTDGSLKKNFFSNKPSQTVFLIKYIVNNYYVMRTDLNLTKNSRILMLEKKSNTTNFLNLGLVQMND